MTSISSQVCIVTTEMHSGGEPLRIVESGYPEVHGETVLEKRRYLRDHLDHLRQFLIFEPRGHYDMYGAILVTPDEPEDVDTGVLFLNNEGYSTMCGHAVISLGRYLIDSGRKIGVEPETEMKIQCPCGVVRVFVEYSNGKSGRVRFHSVPAFAFAIGETVDVEGFGQLTVDIGYGGTFYALIDDKQLGVDVRESPTRILVEAATAVSEAVKKQVKLHHPDSDDLAFLYGTIITDGRDLYSDQRPTANLTVFANREVDRAPTGSGVTARVAVQYAKGQIGLNQVRKFQSGANGSEYTGAVVKETRCGSFDGVVVEVAGNAYYTGKATFTAEDEDELRDGFLLY